MTKSDWYTIALMTVGMLFLALLAVRVMVFVGDVIWALGQVFGG